MKKAVFVLDLCFFSLLATSRVLRLRTADLGSSLPRHPVEAFANRSALESVTISESVKNIADNIFDGANSGLVIYRPAGSVVEQYASQSGFSFEAV